MPDFSQLSNAQLDDAYAAYFDAGDMTSANILGDEIVRRHFASIGDFFTFDFFARYFPKYNVRVSLSGTLQMAGTIVGGGVQAVADAPGQIVQGVGATLGEVTQSVVKASKSVLLPLAVIVVIGAGVYLASRSRSKK